MVSMPAGMGKSVVMGMIAALFEKTFDKIFLLYTDLQLMAFEADMIAGVKELMSGKIEIEVKCWN